MKGDMFYASSVAVTQNSLAATSCTCKAGSHGLDRGVCVHNLPLIFQLILLLVDGLANHNLVELCQRWNSHLEAKIEKLGKLVETKNSILMLMKANGDENTSSLLHLSVNEILKKRFNVGTEKPKSFDFAEPKDEELLPLCLLNTTSDRKKAKQKLKSLIDSETPSKKSGEMMGQKKNEGIVIDDSDSSCTDNDSEHINKCQRHLSLCTEGDEEEICCYSSNSSSGGSASGNNIFVNNSTSSDGCDHDYAKKSGSKKIRKNHKPVLKRDKTRQQTKKSYHQDGKKISQKLRIYLIIRILNMGQPGTFLVTQDGSKFTVRKIRGYFTFILVGGSFCIVRQILMVIMKILLNLVISLMMKMNLIRRR